MNKAPKLRFKKFSGDWKHKKLGNEFILSSGSTPSKSNKEYFNGDNYWVTSGELKKKYIESTIEKISDRAIKESNLKKYPPGTFVIAIYGLEASGTRGSCGILKSSASISQACMAFMSKGNISNEFLYYWYVKYGEKIGIKYAQGTKQQNLNSDLIGGMQIIAPSKEEQEKIASFFSLIDDKISLQDEKVEALKDYKRGMMQKIFRRELRFKDDESRDYPEWESKKLGECIENKGGTALEKFVGEDGTHKFISIGNYSTDGKYIDSGQRISLNDKTKDKLLYKDDLVMVLNDKTSTGDLIGSTILIDEDNTYIYNQRSERLICNENIQPNFAWMLLNYEGFRKKVFSIAQGGTQIYVNFSSVKDLKVELPSLKEQSKISKFILSLDTKLEREQEKLNYLNEYKKGLLQQMFI